MAAFAEQASTALLEILRPVLRRQEARVVAEGTDTILREVQSLKAMVDEILAGMNDCFDEMYERLGRASVPPERLLKSKVLMALYSVRSDRQFCERLNYDLLFQWFLDMNPSESSFHATTFTKNMERLLEHQVSDLFFSNVPSAIIEKEVARLPAILDDPSHFNSGHFGPAGAEGRRVVVASHHPMFTGGLIRFGWYTASEITRGGEHAPGLLCREPRLRPRHRPPPTVPGDLSHDRPAHRR